MGRPNFLKELYGRHYLAALDYNEQVHDGWAQDFA